MEGLLGGARSGRTCVRFAHLASRQGAAGRSRRRRGVPAGIPAGPAETLTAASYCAELSRVDDAFRAHTGRGLDPIWRAPGGRTTPNALAAAKACGYRHVGWSPAGFLGDELPSATHPNRALVEQAVRSVRDGDVLMMHLGIWSRQDPFAPMLDELLARLKGRGFCFATIPERG